MGIYAARRLIWLPFLLLIVTFITFTLIRFGPGDPVEIWLDQHRDDETKQRIRQQLGLDDPLAIQYVRYVEAIVTRLDFGESYRYRNTEVAELIAVRLPVSLQLNLAAILIALGIGIPVGLFAGLRQGSGWDNVAVTIALIFQSLPVFITAPMLLLVLALKLQLLPTSGWDGFFSPKNHHAGAGAGDPEHSHNRPSGEGECAGCGWVRTTSEPPAPRGLNENVVRVRHILRNALIPVVTSMGGDAGGTGWRLVYRGNVFWNTGYGTARHRIRIPKGLSRPLWRLPSSEQPCFWWQIWLST